MVDGALNYDSRWASGDFSELPAQPKSTPLDIKITAQQELGSLNLDLAQDLPSLVNLLRTIAISDVKNLDHQPVLTRISPQELHSDNPKSSKRPDYWILHLGGLKDLAEKAFDLAASRTQPSGSGAGLENNSNDQNKERFVNLVLSRARELAATSQAGLEVKVIEEKEPAPARPRSQTDEAKNFFTPWPKKA